MGVKNKEGMFVSQNGAKRPVMIFVYLIFGIAIIGILSAIVLASLDTARQKGIEAAEQNTVNTGYSNSNQ